MGDRRIGGSARGRKVTGRPGESFELFCVEIPDRSKERCLLYQLQGGGTYRKLDDFVSSPLAWSEARVEPERVLYLSRNGEVQRLRPR